MADQIIADTSTVSPFSNVMVADSNAGQQTEQVTVSLSAPANGTLSDLSGGTYDASTGVYQVSGTAAQVSTALQNLVFNPTIVYSATSGSVATSFTIQVTDTAGQSASDGTTSVMATDLGPPVTNTFSGASSQYQIADDNGSLYIQDLVSGRDGTQTLSGGTEMVFTNGVGFFDPTGSAEQIARLYGAALDRSPDVAGLQYWTAEVNDAHVPLVDVANSFAASPEFIHDYGALSDAGYIDQLYQNVLGRSADASGSAYWQGVLANGASRGAVLVGFAESQEYEADTIATAGDPNNAEVYRLYEATLGRAPDASGQAYWASVLANGASPTDVAAGFVGSAEFQSDYGTLSPSDFVSTLYQNVLHRAADSSGLQYWTNLLDQGASRAQVVVGFADSVEYRAQTAAATHANWVFIPS